MSIVDTQVYNRSRAQPCPECASKNWTKVKMGSAQYYRCWDCDHTWETSSNDWNRRNRDVSKRNRGD